MVSTLGALPATEFTVGAMKAGAALSEDRKEIREFSRLWHKRQFVSVHNKAWH
jgi:hypothetical protein